jgi:hypothetical protein
MFVSKFFDPEKIKIVYKLLHDLLFVLTIFFLLALIADGLLPGIVSSHIGFYKIILAILFIILLINLTSKKAGVFTSSYSDKKLQYVLLFILATLILNGMRNIGLSVSIFVLILALTALYLSYKIFFTPTASS